MDDYISREAALNFEMEIEADPEEIQAITKGMALYADYIKKVPAANVVERKAETYADRIRAMTDEELATFLCEYGDCPCVGDKFCERGTRCEDAVLMWLKQEAK